MIFFDSNTDCSILATVTLFACWFLRFILSAFTFFSPFFFLFFRFSRVFFFSFASVSFVCVYLQGNLPIIKFPPLHCIWRRIFPLFSVSNVQTSIERIAPVPQDIMTYTRHNHKSSVHLYREGEAMFHLMCFSFFFNRLFHTLSIEWTGFYGVFVYTSCSIDWLAHFIA